MTLSPPARAPWFLSSPTPTRAHEESTAGERPQLFALSYAGAGASAFRGWAQRLPEFEVLPVQLPGRENRWSEPAIVDPVSVARAIATEVDHAERPYLIYGHSLGGRLGYEVVRTLAAWDAPLPERLVVGGSTPPELPNVGLLRQVSRETDDVMIERLTRLGGIAPEVTDSPELLDLVLPAIRGDFTWIDDYEWSPGGPLPVPITALCGTRDGVCPPFVGAGWSRHSAPGFRLASVPGGHFFLHEQFDAVARVLRAAAPSSARPAGPSATPGTIDPGSVHLWHLDLDDEPDPPAGSLTEEQEVRAARFRRDQDRSRYRTRCALVARLLTRIGFDAGALAVGAGGKPALPHDHAISWSHSRGLLLLGLGRGVELGVDVERLHPLTDADAMGSVALSRREAARLAGLPTHERNDWLLAVWTVKEALLKASGDGLMVEPSTVDLSATIHHLDPPTRALRAVVPGRADLGEWAVEPLRLPDSVGAVATRVPAREWSLWDARSLR